MPAPTTILAFDFGLRRIGVAVGQSVTGSASPLGVVANRESGIDHEAIAALVREWRPARLVVGMPAHADGSDSEMRQPVLAFIDELKRRSAERVPQNQEFHYVMEDMERLRKKLDENRVSLNEDARKKELQDEKARKETRSKERLARHEEEPNIYRVTLDNVDKPNLQLIMYPGDGVPPVEVLPQFATMVVFLSREIAHEVLPANRTRYSIAGWFRLNARSSRQINPFS